jgi:hypothetical protein
MVSLSAQDDAKINGSATNGDRSVGREFTWKELSKLNEPHNAHVAYRGKVSCTALRVKRTMSCTVIEYAY